MARIRDIRENALFTIAKQEIPIGFLLLSIQLAKDLNILNFY